MPKLWPIYHYTENVVYKNPRKMRSWKFEIWAKQDELYRGCKFATFEKLTVWHESAMKTVHTTNFKAFDNLACTVSNLLYHI
jgi:hypothetical protein